MKVKVLCLLLVLTLGFCRPPLPRACPPNVMCLQAE